MGAFPDFSQDNLAATSAKCKSVRKPQANLPDTPVDLTSAPKYFQMLPGPLELSKVLSDSARAFSGAPESTCSYGGAAWTDGWEPCSFVTLSSSPILSFHVPALQHLFNLQDFYTISRPRFCFCLFILYSLYLEYDRV